MNGRCNSDGVVCMYLLIGPNLAKCQCFGSGSFVIWIQSGPWIIQIQIQEGHNGPLISFMLWCYEGLDVILKGWLLVTWKRAGLNLSQPPPPPHWPSDEEWNSMRTRKLAFFSFSAGYLSRGRGRAWTLVNPLPPPPTLTFRWGVELHEDEEVGNAALAVGHVEEGRLEP